jgi:hypothetical protein
MEKLPQIQDLYNDVEVRQKENDLNVLLNQPPKNDWIKKHPISKVDYIPIERIEYLLTRIFQKWMPEIRDVKVLGNSVVVTIRLWYKEPITGEWSYTDGVGAQPLQTAKGAGAIDFNQLNTSAVQLAAPAAKSYAIKDAAEHLGKLFGRDLNRADQIGYNSLSRKFNGNKKDQKFQLVLDALDKYQGKDKEDIRKSCREKRQAGEDTLEFYENVLNHLNSGNGTS